MNTKKYLVKEKQKVDLSDYSTTKDPEVDKTEAKEELMPANIEAMQKWQERLYAEDKRALLIVFQAMDAAGKDGMIKHVMRGLNPQGTQVTSFKAPSLIELDHDYLWRIHKNLPSRGNIGIFNRSHYEEVIITRVHDLLSKRQLPEETLEGDVYGRRFQQIRHFEKYLYENGIHVLKFFLHLSREEQAKRLLARIENPDKNWKFSAGDITERAFWDQYQEAYEQMLEGTSTDEAPWYVIPADQKWFSRYLVSEIVKEKLEEMNPKFPTISAENQAALAQAREQLLEDLKLEVEREDS